MARKTPILIPQTLPRCCGKNRYPSRLAAEQVAEEQMIIYPALALAVYACTCGCSGWHLTRGPGDIKSSDY